MGEFDPLGLNERLELQVDSDPDTRLLLAKLANREPEADAGRPRPEPHPVIEEEEEEEEHEQQARETGSDDVAELLARVDELGVSDAFSHLDDSIIRIPRAKPGDGAAFREQDRYAFREDYGVERDSLALPVVFRDADPIRCHGYLFDGTETTGDDSPEFSQSAFRKEERPLRAIDPVCPTIRDLLGSDIDSIELELFLRLKPSIPV
jgi:hypothetical protein